MASACGQGGGVTGMGGSGARADGTPPKGRVNGSRCWKGRGAQRKKCVEYNTGHRPSDNSAAFRPTVRAFLCSQGFPFPSLPPVRLVPVLYRLSHFALPLPSAPPPNSPTQPTACSSGGSCGGAPPARVAAGPSSLTGAGSADRSEDAGGAGTGGALHGDSGGGRTRHWDTVGMEAGAADEGVKGKEALLKGGGSGGGGACGGEDGVIAAAGAGVVGAVSAVGTAVGVAGPSGGGEVVAEGAGGCWDVLKSCAWSCVSWTWPWCSSWGARQQGRWCRERQREREGRKVSNSPIRACP